MGENYLEYVESNFAEWLNGWSSAAVFMTTTNQRRPPLTHDMRKFPTELRFKGSHWRQPWEFPPVSAPR